MELKLKALNGKQEKKRLEKQIEETQKALDAMKRAHKTMIEFLGSFSVGLLTDGTPPK